MGDWIKELLTLFWDYLKCWVLVNHWEEAIILRKGQYLKTRKPGLYYKHPFIDYSLEVSVKPDTIDIEPLSITTLDGESISIGMMLEFQIVDSKAFKIDTNDAISNMKDLARGELSDHLEELAWADIKKKTTKTSLKKKIQEHFTYMGVEIKELKFTHKAKSKVLRLFSDKHVSY